ncbi:MAG: NADH-quinone oxidoreductase subunit NuoE [Chitinophagaceae bacterium]|nr:NADH-quinone oxidoreductase subunit NuoE [Chitinophagaceae bacterium]
MAEEKIISEEAYKEIEEMFHHVPKKSATCIEALKVVQKYHRWVSDERLKELAKFLEMTPHELDSIATFYNMIFRRPVGRHTIHVCNSVSCWIMGYEAISGYLKKKLAIDYGQTTPDDRFTLLPIPCLGACDHAPTMIIDEDLYRDLTVEKIDGILENYK